MSTADDVAQVATNHGITAAAEHYGWSPTRIANELDLRDLRPGPVLLKRCDCDRCSTWRAYAACRPYDTDLWFAVPAKDDHPDWDAPRAVCNTCPVRQECEDHAVQRGLVNDGMWGGRTPNQLRRIRRRQRTASGSATRDAGRETGNADSDTHQHQETTT